LTGGRVIEDPQTNTL